MWLYLKFVLCRVSVYSELDLDSFKRSNLYLFLDIGWKHTITPLVHVSSTFSSVHNFYSLFLQGNRTATKLWRILKGLQLSSWILHEPSEEMCYLVKMCNLGENIWFGEEMCDLVKMAVILERLLISRLFNMRYFYSCFFFLRLWK